MHTEEIDEFLSQHKDYLLYDWDLSVDITHSKTYDTIIYGNRLISNPHDEILHRFMKNAYNAIEIIYYANQYRLESGSYYNYNMVHGIWHKCPKNISDTVFRIIKSAQDEFLHEIDRFTTKEKYKEIQ